MQLNYKKYQFQQKYFHFNCMQSPPEIELKVPLIHFLVRLESSHRSFLVTFISSANPAQLSKHKPLNRKKATPPKPTTKVLNTKKPPPLFRQSCPADVRAHQTQSALQELCAPRREPRGETSSSAAATSATLKKYLSTQRE